jgi:hypothetical protein
MGSANRLSHSRQRRCEAGPGAPAGSCAGICAGVWPRICRSFGLSIRGAARRALRRGRSNAGRVETGRVETGRVEAGRVEMPRSGRERLLHIQGHQLFHQPPAGRGHQPQFAAVVGKWNGQHPRLLQKVAIERQRGDHVARIMRHLGQALATAAQRGQRVHHRLRAPLARALQIPHLPCLLCLRHSPLLTRASRRPAARLAPLLFFRVPARSHSGLRRVFPFPVPAMGPGWRPCGRSPPTHAHSSTQCRNQNPARNPGTASRSFPSSWFRIRTPRCSYRRSSNPHPACSHFSFKSSIAAPLLTRCVPNQEQKSKFLIRDGFP